MCVNSGQMGAPGPDVIRISAGLLVARCEDGPRLLLGKRAADRVFYPGVWDLIGGHVEEGGTPVEAMVRELAEEIGVTPLVWWEVDRMVIPAGRAGGDPIHDLIYWAYAVTSWAGVPRNLQPAEHDAIGWFTVEDACALDLADASYPALFRRMGRPAPDGR